jgi:hypothetical protein
LSSLHQGSGDHCAPQQAQGVAPFAPMADSVMPAAIALMHEQAALAMQAAAH